MALKAVPERFTRGITRMTAADVEDVEQFKRQQFGAGARQLDPARERWLYEENPFLDEAGRTVLIARRQDEIVGMITEIPFELQIGTDRRRAAWPVDLTVEAAWRMRGIGPGLISTLAQGHSIVVPVNLSDHGYGLFTSLGMTDLGIVPVYVRPLDARRVLAAPQTPAPDKVRRLAPVAGPALRALDASVRTGLRAAGLRAVAVDALDERVDEVWERAAPHYPVLARRDSGILAWRIDARPDRDRLLRYYLARGRETLGYVVLRPALSGDTPVAVVVDYLAPPRWVAPLLLAGGWGAARQAGSAALAVRSRNIPADRSLRAAGFLRRDSVTDPPIRHMVTCTDEPGICALVSDPDSWFVTSADCDLEHGTVASSAASSLD